MEETARKMSGRFVFGSVLIIAVVIGAVLGLVIGTSTEIQHIALLELVTFHPTPIGMAFYGATASTVLVGTVLGIVLLLSRFDDAAVQ
jgi:prolipoprotein diacylglyceryltransferase